MFTLENEVLPLQAPTNRNLGLSLFWSVSTNNNSFFTADSQVNTRSFNTPTYKTIIEEDPVPTKSKIFILRGLLDISGFEEVRNLFLLDNSRYFKNYIEEVTYVVAPASFSGVLPLTVSYGRFSTTISDSIMLELNLSESVYSIDDISSIEVGGFSFTKSLTEPINRGYFFYDLQTRILKIHSSKTCGITPNSTILIKADVTEEEAIETFDLLRFEYPTNTKLDFIDSIYFENKVFYRSTEIESGSVLYNKSRRVALCLL